MCVVGVKNTVGFQLAVPSLCEGNAPICKQTNKGYTSNIAFFYTKMYIYGQKSNKIEGEQ